MEQVQDALAVVVRSLLGPLLTEATVGDGWRVVSWDADQGINLLFGRGDSLLIVEIDLHEANNHGLLHTERFTISGRPQFERPRSLTDDEQALLHILAETLRQREVDLPAVESSPTGRKQMVREVVVDRVLCQEGRGYYYLNPYVGCMIGCPYCYVSVRADACRSLAGLPRLPWGRWVDVKINAAEVLREEVARLPPGFVRISPIVTDPYQGVERRYGITRACLEVLADAEFPVAVLTRANRVVADIPILQRFSRKLVGLSIPTDDDRIRRLFEPGADPIEARIAALRACHDAGLPTMAFIQPMLPMDPERLVALLSPHVQAVRIERMQAPHLSANLYAKHGLQDAATTAFFDKTEAALRSGFAARGVLVDPIEDLGALVDQLQAR